MREARAAATIHHPNVCPVYEAGMDGDTPFLVMHYVPGPTLAAILEQRRTPLPPRHAAAIVRKLALGIAAAHTNGVIHRDLKPANVLVNEVTREVLITDFGLARLAGEARMSTQGEVMGTPAYMSPEQGRGDIEAVGPLSDIYSLGVILYHLVTGTLPFTGSVMEFLIHLQYSAPKPPSELIAGVDRALDAICLKSMAKAPQERYQSAKDFANALTDFLRGIVHGESLTPSQEVLDLDERSDTSKQELVPLIGTTPLPLAPPMLLDSRPMPSLPPALRERKIKRSTKTRGSGYGRLSVASAVAAAFLTICLAVGVGHRLGRRNNESVADQSTQNTIPFDSIVENRPPKERPSLVPGEELVCEISPGTRMIFCWIPPGTSVLGAPKTELGWSPNEQERNYTSKGFFLGKYEVTQAEWIAVMGYNPSTFRGNKSGPVFGMDTSRFPVEELTWDNCQSFAQKINESKFALLNGYAGRFCLPHEDEWEFACRGGKGNKEPFYFGSVLNGLQANDGGRIPYGTKISGAFLDRTTSVGSYSAKYPHPWGLCDMHGNVWEFCSTSLPNAAYVIRGGAHAGYGIEARAARRNLPTSTNPLAFHYSTLGMRLCFRVDE